MFSNVAINVDNLSKCYQIYNQPRDRLKQMIVPRLQRLVGQEPSQYFREFWAVKGVSVEIKRGETVGIIGRNGSGKSTLLQMICGIVSSTTGSVVTNGRVAALLELGAGFNPEFTGRQNAVLNAKILGLADGEITEKISAIEAFAEIGEFFDQPVKTYSSGMYVRVAFAVQAAVDPDILIVDEALSVGDAPFQAKCMSRLKNLKEQGTSILFVSHSISSVRQLCDRAIWLHEGEIVRQGNTAEVTGNYIQFVFGEDDIHSRQPEIVDEPPSSGEEVSSCTRETVDENGCATPNNVDVAPTPVNSQRSKKPVSHWGSDVGCILECELQNMLGERLEIIENIMPIQVSLKFRKPKNVNIKGFGAAIAVKSLNGFDIMVSNTYDRKVVLEENNFYHILFKMKNFLSAGEYILVGMVEDRSQINPRYYEFIEGVQYFRVQHDEKHFGQCIVPVEHVVTHWG